jgi:hypothetical protein
VVIPPQEGLGQGQFYLLVTESESQQLGSDDFKVPAYGFAASIQSERPVEDLTGYADTWFTYQVSQNPDAASATEKRTSAQPAGPEPERKLRETFECTEPGSGRATLRIMGGTSANPRDYPWQVAIKGTYAGLCGGSLIGR